MTLHEPATFATDVLLGTLAAALVWRLRARTSSDNRAAAWWCRAFALTAGSAFIGGSYHGFAPNVPGPIAAVWWSGTLLVICLLSAAMDFGLLYEFSPAPPPAWRGLVTLKAAGFGAAALFHPAFVVVIIDYGLTMLAWAAAAVVLRRPWASWMLGAIVLSIVAAAGQQLHWAPSPRFNHNDLYHLLQALTLLGFYRAARRLNCVNQ